MKVDVHKIEMASPDDVSGLEALIDGGIVDPSEIVAFIGKTEGNGGANDFTRGYATLSFKLLLARKLSCSPEQIGKRVVFVWSGGTEGVLTPHATIFTRSPNVIRRDEKRLVVGFGHTRRIFPAEIGTIVHVGEVAAAVRAALGDAGISDPADVHYVQVKGPLLTMAAIAEADAQGKAVVSRDPNASKIFARGAMGLGVAVALGEVDAGNLTDAMIGKRLDLFSAVASTSAGGELTACEVVLFGNASGSASNFRVAHDILEDLIDADAVRRCVHSAGPGGNGQGSIAAVFAKAEVAPNGRIRGRRNTMLSDADINYERHARAALGAVIASVTGDPAIFVSGGTEHQCGPGQAPIAAIVSCSQ
jgi:cyanuric acid amidohydrolase